MAKQLVNLGELALQVTREASDPSSKKKPNIIEYIEAPWGLGAKPFPVQKVILKAFYGIPLDETTKFTITDWRRENPRRFTEADYLKYCYDKGRTNIREVREEDAYYRRELVLPIGRRSGKTELSAWISCFEIDNLLQKYNPQQFYGIAQADAIKLACVATAKDQAAILYGKVKGYLMSCSRFSPYRANNTQSFYRFQTQYEIEQFGRYGREDDATASLAITFYSSVAKGLRGHGNIVIILDEVAHFTEAGGSSAEEIYKSIRPSTAAFSPKDPLDPTTALKNPDGNQMVSDARIILISSPLGKEGLFYQKFQQSMKHPDLIFAMQAPTWEVNPSIAAPDFISAYETDPKAFFVEFGAEFSDAASGWIDNREDLFKCIDPKRKRIWRAPSRRPHFIGIDIGVTKGGDGSAVAIGHLEDGKICLDYLEYVKAGEGDHKDEDRLDFDWLADWIHALSKRFHIVEGLFDQWAGIPFEQSLHKKGLKQIEMKQFTRDETSYMYKTFKDMMWAEKLSLYNWEEDTDNPQTGRILDANNNELCGYLEELLTLQETRVSEKIAKVEAPRRDGLHDDRSDALVRMVWLAAQKLGSKKYMSGGTPRGGVASSYQSNPRRSAYQGGSDPLRRVPRRRGR